MLLKTILNSIEKHPLFIYGTPKIITNDGEKRIEIPIRARKGSKGSCSSCHKPAPGYDTLANRRFSFIPLWGFLVFFLYAPRRVDCPDCGVKVEIIPWANGKSNQTKSYAWFLADWAKVLNWKEVATHFKTSWYHVFTAVKMAVAWGRDRMDIDNITAIGVDEVKWQKGIFVTLVYQIDNNCKRLLWVQKHRTKYALRTFFNWIKKERSHRIKYVCSDMWKPYLTVIKERAINALNILDRYHVAAKMNKAIDKVRAAETKKAKREAPKGAEVILTNSRWCLLKNKKNLTLKQGVKLKDLLKVNLQTVRAYLLKEEFQHFWQYQSPTWARKFMKTWCTKTMRSKIEPMKKIAKMLRAHEDLIMNWFEVKGAISLGAVEGLNNKLKASVRNSYGFKTFDALQIALYHRLGKLPEPEKTHRYF
ncbi:MAG: ISL3 family transposase [Oligoflexia bacterium]|nr:ISL3 family transposase [Oligoflexia bacterium]